MPELGGLKGTVSSEPCINILKIDERSDFILMGCDGIFDRLDNDKIFKKIWEYKKQNKSINDIHTFCGQITDAIIKYSMEKDSADNVSVVFIAFKNFENKMKDPNFVCTLNNKTQILTKDTFDFSLKKI
jgi:protein phosphatase 2C family protein 2/3